MVLGKHNFKIWQNFLRGFLKTHCKSLQIQGYFSGWCWGKGIEGEFQKNPENSQIRGRGYSLLKWNMNIITNIKPVQCGNAYCIIFSIKMDDHFEVQVLNQTTFLSSHLAIGERRKWRLGLWCRWAVFSPNKTPTGSWGSSHPSPKTSYIPETDIHCIRPFFTIWNRNHRRWFQFHIVKNLGWIGRK